MLSSVLQNTGRILSPTSNLFNPLNLLSMTKNTPASKTITKVSTRNKSTSTLSVSPTGIKKKILKPTMLHSRPEVCHDELRDVLQKRSNAKYLNFSLNLRPRTEGTPTLGVTLGDLRDISKEITGMSFENYLKTARDTTFEEILIQGIVAATVKVPLEKRFELITPYISKITDWSLCDSFCVSLKETKKNKEEYRKFIMSYASSPNPYDQRFVAVMLLLYYSTDAPGEMDETLKMLDSLKHEDYYVKMAVAWGVATCFINHPHLTLPYLQEKSTTVVNTLDKWTYNKALSKITDSFRVDAKTKEMIRELRKK